MRILLSLAILAMLSAPALACINDSELISHEREFKSQYQESNYTPPEPEQISSSKPYLLGGAGAMMGMAGAFVLLRLRSAR
ncbi:MAG: hypothetical protein EXS09_03360 [Gemmataceae bacterium]|nr:hypothetical protein [Gemmataceae bacterium]